VEGAEYPHRAAEREVLEELGLHITPGELLVVHWQLPDGDRPRAGAARRGPDAHTAPALAGSRSAARKDSARSTNSLEPM